VEKNDTKVLLVDDDDDVLQAGRLFLKQHVSLVRTVRDPETLPGILDAGCFDVIFLDMNFAPARRTAGRIRAG
jgi:DNA-binding NtrC family response regulator